MTLGIDIGGTNLVFGLVENGRIRRKFSVPSFKKEATMEQTLEYLSEQISSIITRDTTKIGVGVPTLVDAHTGVVYDAGNIPSWKVVPLQAYLEERFGVPVSVGNDANCFAMAAYGAYPEDAKPEVLVGITLGTGTGLGIVDRGRLFCGANSGAGELCSLPYRGTMIEDYCSKKFFEGRGWDSKAAAMAAIGGDTAARALFDEFGMHLGELVCNVLYAYDPSHIAFGGGIAHSLDLFRPSMEAYVREHFPYSISVDHLTITAFADDDFPVIGASLI
ncbi:MAG: ROK family protein [Bacteroidales bacterium]|nr:ROK family protein [Bacteroidales bacterium]